MLFRENRPTIDFDAIRLKIASPEVIRHWSFGEVRKPETINYRTQKPEKGGLFAEEIFGPTKDWECYCGKYKKIRYKGIVCDKCGVEVTTSLVRRERMGHIELTTPVAHIWFLRSVPSKIGLVLDLSAQALEKVIYFASFIITHVDEEGKKQAFDLLRQEFKSKKKQIENETAQAIKAATDKKLGQEAWDKIQEEGTRKIKVLEADFQQADKELKELQVLRIVSENRYQEMSLRYGHLFEASIGAEAVYNLLSRVNLQETYNRLTEEQQKVKGAKLEKIIRRKKLLKSLLMNEIRPEWMVMKCLPVVPPDLRPMVALDGGRFATSDLNDLYRRVINRNNRLQRLTELNAPEVICRNEKRMLQEAVDALIDNNARHAKTVAASTGQRRQLRSLADILKGKQGRFRQNLLGKRVDYSGRSVIVVGPNLNIDECGLPKRMALELFKPFIMAEIIKRELAHNVRSASRFIESERDEVWDILEELTKTTRVLLNRAPTLHRLGIQAFHPRLIEGNAIQLHPLVCTAFNADFDGDQMAVHLPLTKEARWEADNLMAAEKNILKPATGSPVITPKQDIVLGCFYLTRLDEDQEEKKTFKHFTSEKEALLAYKNRLIDLHERIKVRFVDLSKFPEGTKPLIETTVGRIIFNDGLPEKIPYYNEVINVKKLAKIISLILEFYGQQNTAVFLDDLKNLGFKYATKSGYSLSMMDFPKIVAKEGIIKEAEQMVRQADDQFQEGLLTQTERHARILEIWTETKEKVVANNQDTLGKNGPVYAMIESGARGTWGQLGQVIGMKGLVASPSGDIMELPVKGNFKEGFDSLEFFISSHGTRKGLSDTALRTSGAGYLTRRLVDVCQDMVILEEDCGDNVGEIFTEEQSQEMGEKLSDRVWGRYALEDVKVGNKVLVKAGEMIDEKIARVIEESQIKSVHVRSVLQCKLPKGVCQKCYGYDLSYNKPAEMGTSVGVIAAQSIGEPGTQLTLRTFHTGGVAGSDITQGLPRVEELFEARNPKHQAFLSEVDGEVEIEDADGKIITSPSGKKLFEGRRGQKIIKIHFEGMDETKIKFTQEDEVLVKDGEIVAEDTVLLVRGSDGEEIKAKYPGNVKVGKSTIVLSYEGPKVREYVVPLGYKLYVNSGDKVKRGDQLTNGSINLHELHELRGRSAVQRYILEETQNIYSSQGQKVNDKHMELIIKQMFSRVYIEDAGETDLLPGEIVEKAQVEYSNRQTRKEGGKEAVVRELLLGISRVSLSTQSFLSAASFQETARVLINTAITGKIDYLEGLKENVIIGRLIPCGTGFKK
ncbi:MAG: DNA-directed RNA polymerase subunit beta' [Candidatus Magasanikbacteria bacterium CG10_big_fil_rev_8_21_14_0_10_36_32]|uniref:DNA-directed RNA polymerase subunit beta' n=1 Tax=Candidatus Magasanikbacteria bacterium CG10_big_fil_rev_8_21_14_0_10_36_32 TaxID=1974646 RepID=A0A2M6W6V9_9BACT|nr:MAG: DNA-directed RNA polymerase subunit beta' [Candidatus Magasanikbacteria bacterium CG10_big_fil_rev_8_21_14_0_10_36_32]